MRMTRLLLAALLVIVVTGCAQKADWVEGTLVTVDVAGTWKGRLTGNRLGGEMQMTLTQRGPKVTGDGRIGTATVSIEGTVRGDVLFFSEPGGRLRGQATVTGDQMSGQGRTNLSAMGSGQQTEFLFTLSR